jgi:hypothetical protein
MVQRFNRLKCSPKLVLAVHERRVERRQQVHDRLPLLHPQLIPGCQQLFERAPRVPAGDQRWCAVVEQRLR